MVLMAVLFFVLLATAGVASFLSRAMVDGMAASNRDGAASAEALARGGVRLAEARAADGPSRRAAERVPGRHQPGPLVAAQRRPVPARRRRRAPGQGRGRRREAPPERPVLQGGGARREDRDLPRRAAHEGDRRDPGAPRAEALRRAGAGPQPDRLGRRRLRPRRRRRRGRVLPGAAPALPAGEPATCSRWTSCCSSRASTPSS